MVKNANSSYGGSAGSWRGGGILRDRTAMEINRRRLLMARLSAAERCHRYIGD